MRHLRVSVALMPFLLLACGQAPSKPADTTAATPSPITAAATSPSAATPPFQHDPRLDVFGYYFSQTPIQVGNWALKSVNLGAPSDFAAWEEGKRPSNFGPVFLEFEDVTSPTAENELGQTYHTVSFRLLAESYRVGAGQVTFRGKDTRIGEVSFSGGLDLAGLQAARAAGPGGADKPVLTGDLQIGATRLRNIGFVYFAGD